MAPPQGRYLRGGDAIVRGVRPHVRVRQHVFAFNNTCAQRSAASYSAPLRSRRRGADCARRVLWREEASLCSTRCSSRCSTTCSTLSYIYIYIYVYIFFIYLFMYLYLYILIFNFVNLIIKKLRFFIY